MNIARAIKLRDEMNSLIAEGESLVVETRAANARNEMALDDPRLKRMEEIEHRMNQLQRQMAKMTGAARYN